MFKQQEIVWCMTANKNWWPAEITEAVECLKDGRLFWLYSLKQMGSNDM
jgi:hypothetical protein